VKLSWTWIVVAVAGCSKSNAGIDVGPIKQLSISIERSRGEPHGYYLGVRFDVQPRPDELVVRAACQVETRRYVDIGPAELDAGARPGGMPPSVPFIITMLEKRPELCELTFFERSPPTTTLAVVCARTGQPPVVGACPANPVDGAGTAAGFSVPSLAARIDPREKRFFVDYVVQAHRDQDPNASVRIQLTCKDGSTDKDQRSEPGRLRAGESIRAFYSIDVTDPSGPCSIVLDVNGAVIQAFCATGGDTVTPGACPG
jgi:hypothetical protein